MGQHDRHGLPEHRHRPVVAVGLPRHRAGAHRLRLRARRRQHRGAGRSGAPPRPRRVDGGRCMPLVRYIAPAPAVRRAAALRHPPGQLLAGEADPGRPGRADARPLRHAGASPSCASKLGLDQAAARAVPASIWATSCTATSAPPGRPRGRSPRICSSASRRRWSWSPSACCWPSRSASRSASPPPASSAVASRKFADYYGLLAGALPDFWLALVLIYVFYTMLDWTPAPLGRIDMAILPPPTVTGSAADRQPARRRLGGARLVARPSGRCRS